VDGKSFGSDSVADPDTKKRYDLVSVARLAPIKRLDLLIEAVALLKEHFPSIQAVIVGDGTDRDRLERARRDSRVEHQVTLAGFQSDVASYLRASRIFVMTSASEGLPLALIEAMLCGLPAVAPAIGDIEDLVRHGENGYLFSPGDVAGCSKCIATLLASSNLKTMGQAARVSARAYTVEGRVNLWSSWINALAESSPGAAGP
jgi:glycosyltransferase involved in cell wall biosynthesis